MRYAAYYAPPPGDPLADAAAAWLGRNAWSGAAVAQPNLPGLADVTRGPRRYGFHATLKAPFALKAGAGRSDVEAAMAVLASRLGAVRPVPLSLSIVPGFLALVPAEPCTALDDLAAACVEALDPLRAPLDPDERRRRHAAGLSRRESELLERWGYPFVMDRFRFHMTLSEPLAPDALRALAAAAAAHFGGVLSRPVAVDALCLFVEPPGEDFRAVARLPLQRARESAA
jgi:putative phosphonate metabolism protein